MKHLLVIGSPSLDRIHINGNTYETLGGAGLYVALAAHRSGIDVSMFGPRPTPAIEEFYPFSKILKSWIGPTIPAENISRFEISHHAEKADYLFSSLEEETSFNPDSLPGDLTGYAGVHVTQMGDADVQHAIIAACRERGVKMISMGTWVGSIIEKKDTVKLSVEMADVVFMNKEEGSLLYGSVEDACVNPGQIMYITCAEKGALIFQGNHCTKIEAVQTNMLDPTGAGETFCGAVLANLLLGKHPIIAGKRASALAAEKVAQIGPRAILKADPPPGILLDDRVRIDSKQVEKVSAVVRTQAEASPFNFVADFLPPPGHSKALDYFFTVMLHQFSFWVDDGKKYIKPMITQIDGSILKGSSYLFNAFTRQLRKDAHFFTPERQARITEENLLTVFRADDGTDPMPAIELHVQQSNQYGRDMLALGLTPKEILLQAQDSQNPLDSLIQVLDHIGGYKEDPIRKKSNLLALCLNQRPEQFIRFGTYEAVSPVVDYHCMRSCLRMGLVEVLDPRLKKKIEGREIVSGEEEWAVRYAAYQIQEQVEALSGKPIGAVDWFFFNYMRSHCPEMTDPDCQSCAVDAVCAHRKEMFQPVVRTTFY